MRGKHRSTACLYSRYGFSRLHGCPWSIRAWHLSQSCIFIATQVTLHHKHLNHYCFMVKSTEINAAHTHNHEAKDLSSEKGSNFCSIFTVSYSKCCLLEINRLTRVYDTERRETLEEYRIRGVIGSATLDCCKWEKPTGTLVQKFWNNFWDHDMKGIFQNCIPFKNCWKAVNNAMLQIYSKDCSNVRPRFSH